MFPNLGLAGILLRTVLHYNDALQQIFKKTSAVVFINLRIILCYLRKVVRNHVLESGSKKYKYTCVYIAPL